MATKNETFINEFKINYLTEEQYQEALTNNEINDDELYLTQEDIESMATELVNMHVWKVYDAEPTHTETTVANGTVYSSMSGENIKHSNKISIIDGKVSLCSPVTTRFTTSTIENLRGKYFTRNTATPSIYLFPADAELTTTSSTSQGFTTWTIKASTLIQYVDTTATKSGYVASRSNSTYPTNGLQDGSWYVYINQLGEAYDTTEVISSTGAAGQFAVSDGNGGITWLTVKNGNEVAY